MRFCTPLILLVTFLSGQYDAFQIIGKNQQQQRQQSPQRINTGDSGNNNNNNIIILQRISSSSSTKLFSTANYNNQFVSLERTAQRDIDQFQNWAGSCGVQAENGFYIQGQMVDGNEDYFAASATGTAQGSRILSIPSGMILSSSVIAQEYQGYADASLQVLEQMGMMTTPQLYHQFHLFLKILAEYEKGAESPYLPWLEAMPRKWNTAVSMDEFCLSCLPPFIKSLCVKEREQLGAFRTALTAFEYLSPESKNNEELMKFAYNIVVTRSFPCDEYGDYRIIPVADMINHGYPDNVAIVYNGNSGDCEVYAKEDVPPGSPFTLSYGEPTNPSRFLATFGFLNEESPAVFCKLYFENPSQELINIGYGDPNQLLFSTQDGSISPQVWDVLLYSRLERKRDLEHYKRAFYQAVMSGDEETKAAIHGQFQNETINAMLLHVNHILAEVAELMVKMNSYDSSKHPRLPLLKKHHEMVTSTFTKVRDYLMAIKGE